MAEQPKVFDIKKCEVRVNGVKMTDIAPDGFGISPLNEVTIIDGLQGPVGFNMDPTTAVEATITLKSTSPEHATLREISQKQQQGLLGPIALEVVVEPGFVSAFGFAKKSIPFAMIKSPAELETDEKESPDYEYNFIGYGYTEE